MVNDLLSRMASALEEARECGEFLIYHGDVEDICERLGALHGYIDAVLAEYNGQIEPGETECTTCGAIVVRAMKNPPQQKP